MIARNILNFMVERQDLTLVGILMMTILLMILPVPTFLIDALIALNISFTILILMVAIYLVRPADFSTFPAIILIGTAFRLSISISTTRLILTQGDAGAVIDTFGSFVTAGNIIVGLVIFVIITTVQFVVVTKGAERIAEVAARFILDALPGRQMSIDAELRSNAIDQEEANERRRLLDRENQFFGAMDGAMKFVKGDAIAGLIIIVVNLLGGIGIGMLQQGLAFGDAVQIYSRLTVGDGLVAQIPALLMALCAGAVVTRVSTEERLDLGTDIAKQLLGNSRTLAIAGTIVIAIGLIPGFPKFAFFAIAAALGVGAWLMHRRAREQQAAAGRVPIQDGIMEASATSDFAENVAQFAAADVEAKAGDRVVIRLDSSLRQKVPNEDFAKARAVVTSRFQNRFGYTAPLIGLLENPSAAAGAVSIDLDGVTLFSATVPEGMVLARAEAAVIEVAGVSGAIPASTWPLDHVHWVSASDQAKLADADISVVPVAWLLAEAAAVFMRRNAEELLGFEEIQDIVRDANQELPALAKQVAQVLTVTRLLDILRRLVGEGVPLVPRRILFESLLEWASKEDDPAMIAERVRFAMRRHLCRGIAGTNQIIAGYVIEPGLEAELRATVQAVDGEAALVLPANLANTFLQQLERIKPVADPDARPPVVVTSRDLRRYVRNYLRSHGIDLAVVAFQEISSEFNLQPVGTLGTAQNQSQTSAA